MQFKLSHFHQAFLRNAQRWFDFYATNQTSLRDDYDSSRPVGTFGW
jgi:hypothetical protein